MVLTDYGFSTRSDPAAFAVRTELTPMSQLPPNTPRRSMLDFSQLQTDDPPAAGRWSLVRRSDSGDDQHRTSIKGEQFTVGRRPENDLCISHNTVSGQHAELQVVEGGLVLRDLGSTNGTLLNGRRLVPHTEERLTDGDVVHFGRSVFTVEQALPPQSSAGDFSNKTMVADVPEDAVLYQGFDRLLNRPDIDPYFQPIVDLSNWDTVGYEVLVRSKVKGLEFPDRIFRIAAMRMAEARLSEVCRSEGLLAGIQLDPGGKYFLNTHAVELETPRLFDSLRELREDFPKMSIVLEVHEAAVTSVRYLTELSRVLRDLQIDLAYDDFGAGQARLIELFEVPPKYLKFDIAIIRALEEATPVHRASVKALVNMVNDLNVVALAEGVETKKQAEICTELGFTLAQGYFFGRPQPRQFWTDKMLSLDTQQIRAVARPAESGPPLN